MDQWNTNQWIGHSDHQDDRVDVSHGLGIPFGGIGTGYAVFGQYGFVNINYNSTPDAEQSRQYPKGSLWRYDKPAALAADWAFMLREGDSVLLLQERPLDWLPGAQTADRVKAWACLPKGYYDFDKPDWNIDLHMMAFSPLIPHDLDNSSIPVHVFSITLKNRASSGRQFRLELACRKKPSVIGDYAILSDGDGAVGLACRDGQATASGAGASFYLNSGDSKTIRFCLAWHYPLFRTPSAAAPATYRRYYTKKFRSAAAVLKYAEEEAENWSAAIGRWHDAYEVSPCFKRLWFSSLASTITSTMLSADPVFFEIETPHAGVNTMDVTVYSSWLYLVNWPELERLDMRQYLSAIPDQGPDAGHVWHTLWDEGADYVEEPIFPARLYRDFLWLKDRDLLSQAYAKALLAANRVYGKDKTQPLIVSDHGNQSYDGWKMPGVSAFVNSAWIFSLYALDRMAEYLGEKAEVGGLPVDQLLQLALEQYDSLLWNDTEHYWNCFYRTPGASEDSVPDASFLDQLFGQWLLLIDPAAHNLLPAEKVQMALDRLFRNNLVDDPEQQFRGWANGMLPDGRPDLVSGIHARTCWICAQLDLGSLLGDTGDEARSLDVFRSLENSLHNNHLAVGEWNQSVDAQGKSRILPEEPGKDTPRFPPYPRYKCAWEYLVRLLGLKMEEQHFYLDPFKTEPFSIKAVKLAGTIFNVTVKTGWQAVRVNGEVSSLPLRLDRKTDEYTLDFY